MTVALLGMLFLLSFKAASSEALSHVVPRFLQAGQAVAAPAALVPSPFVFSFNSPGTLYEAGKAGESSSPYFWLNSGAKLVIANGIGRTQFSALPSIDPWRLMYNSMNPLDTGKGYYPQNTLRLVTRSSWTDLEVGVRFRIGKTNLTDTPNRDGYSGIFLMGRYVDQYNLYYAGIRHDGTAVIKKKINGTYYTLATTQIFGAEGTYDKWSNPNLLPQNKWLGMKARFTNQSDGLVKIQLIIDRENDGKWVPILSATDTSTGGAPLRNSGLTGLRTDFMDVEFDDFRAEKI